MANFILEDLKQIFGKRNNILSQIIVLNVAVFIVFNIIENFYPISNWFALPGTFGEYILKFWSGKSQSGPEPVEKRRPYEHIGTSNNCQYNQNA